jgi:hypothetical protein
MSRQFGAKPACGVPIEDNGGRYRRVSTTDPEKYQRVRVVIRSMYIRKGKIVYKVCPVREFAATLDTFSGASGRLRSLAAWMTVLKQQKKKKKKKKKKTKKKKKKKKKKKT